MTDQKNGQEYLSFVLEKLQARLAEISQSLLDGQKEIENMHDYYWQNYTEMDQYGYCLLYTSFSWCAVADIF